MKRSSYLVFAVGIVFYASSAFAQAAFQFAVPNFRAPASAEVTGMRISLIHGKNQTQRGLDLGLLSMSETANLSGLALIGGISKVTGTMSDGAAFSLVNWHTGSDSGMNGAFVNLLNEAGGAFNLGFINVAQGTTAVDLGGLNTSKRSATQIGFVNVTDQIDSFQFGFLNMAKNGFLPIFPVVNFPAK